MNVFMMLLTVTIAVYSLSSTLQGRSSFIKIVEDYYLTGHVIDRQKASSVLSCVHLCLRSRPLCLSVNYKEQERTMICELNDEGIVGAGDDTSSLLPMRGFIFAQLFNLTVSKPPLKLVFLLIMSCRINYYTGAMKHLSLPDSESLSKQEKKEMALPERISKLSCLLRESYFHACCR